MTTTIAGTGPRLARALGAACGAGMMLFGAAACGSSGNDANPTGQSAPQQGEAGPQNQQGGPGGAMPGAAGKVAAVDGSTAQVQGMQGQVAVSWTASTTFTKQISAGLADVSVGDCVFVAAEDEGSSGSTTPPTAVTADTVRITEKSNGSCAPTMGGPGGGTDSGPRLEGAPPSGAPQGAQPRQLRGMGGAVGEVTAVSSSGFTVASATPGNDATTSVTVTVDGDTTYTTNADGAASDVKVGVCVQAGGTTDATGAVTATRIAISQPEDGQCGGFVRMRSSDGSTGRAS